MPGFAVYLGQQSMEQTEKYVKKMYDAGFRTMFTSLHIPEDDPSLYAAELKQLGALAIEHGMELMADISPASWQHLGLTLEKAGELTRWGVTGIRVDYGFSPAQIALLSEEITVALNASTMDETFLQQLLNAGLSIDRTEAWHNFYPRPETGLDERWMRDRNRRLQELGLTVMAFIPGDQQLRGPLAHGLPTVEKHRGQSVFAAFLEMTNEFYVDKVCIGDRSIQDATWQQFMVYQENTILIHCDQLLLTAEEERLLCQKHRSRMDPSRDVIRSETSRLYAQKGKADISPRNQLPRPRGTITVDNNLYERYTGELQVALKDLPADKKVNVLGRVIDRDLPLLPMVRPGQSFLFICSAAKT
ncbi:hypothetical protein SAMN05421736_12116 [Evansella caseinilytica]|uniref:Cell surface protein n=1 Tax=Evansella caseinilytica TaxID=1503961 RepID=A0A1H3UG13_9BACI|nr:MupG family TIM beta-alpha barrel fold protein [Evansella caseinilytica]SDZ61217.1 hypothetical protein SAMN05421736_12116 [Evansella caseinilytica]